MTTFASVLVQCPICGNKWESAALTSSNAFGSMDLDTRPPEMARSTMCFWLYECPECGYVARNMNGKATIGKEFLKTEKYVTCDGYTFENSLAKAFYRHHLIMLESGEIMPAITSLLHTIWVCDDAGDENALTLREKLAEMTEARLKNYCDPELYIMRADALRRSYQFDRLISEYEGKKFYNKLVDQIVSIQIKLAKKKDAGCYTVDEATRTVEL